MKRIDQVIRQHNREQELMMQSSVNSCIKVDGQPIPAEQFLQEYSPDYLFQHCRGLTFAEINTLCYFSDTPTLIELNSTYGDKFPQAWLIAQLFVLSEFCGAKEKMPVEVAERTAFIIYSHYYYLKVSELLLFFYKFSTGKYGKFYGTTDPVTIINALATFVTMERNPTLERHENEEALKRKMQESKAAIRRTEYLQQIEESARRGDKTAQLLCDINHINYGSQEDIH